MSTSAVNSLLASDQSLHLLTKPHPSPVRTKEPIFKDSTTLVSAPYPAQFQDFGLSAGKGFPISTCIDLCR